MIPLITADRLADLFFISHQIQDIILNLECQPDGFSALFHPFDLIFICTGKQSSDHHTCLDQRRGLILMNKKNLLHRKRCSF